MRPSPRVISLLTLFGVLAVGVLVLLFPATYALDETEQAVVVQFGKPVGESVVQPGLHFKLPFVQEVRRFDKVRPIGKVRRFRDGPVGSAKVRRFRKGPSVSQTFVSFELPQEWVEFIFAEPALIGVAGDVYLDEERGWGAITTL